MTIDLDEPAVTSPTIADPVETATTVENVDETPDEGPLEVAAAIPDQQAEPADVPVDDELPALPEIGSDHPEASAPKARKQIRTARRGRTTRRPAQPAAAAPAEPPPMESSLLKELSERVTTLETGLIENRQSLADLDQAMAAAVERATTDELVEAKQRVQVAAGSMASLALAIADSAADITADVTSDISAGSVTALLVSFATEVENVLLQLGFSPLHTTVGEPFDPTRHRSLRRVVTSDRSLDKVISKVIRDGYQAAVSKRILLYSDVEVNRFVPHENSN